MFTDKAAVITGGANGIGKCIAGKVRVNSISPGWIDTAYHVYDGADAVQQPVGRVGFSDKYTVRTLNDGDIDEL